MRYYTNYLEHHGIKGQKWGVRRFQNYDGTRIKSSGENYAQNGSKKKGLTDQQKKYLKIGAAVVGTAIVAYGGYKLVTSPQGKELTNRLLNKSKEDWGNYDVGSDIKSAGLKKANLPEEVMQMATNKNPFNRSDNCKEVAHAFCESMYSNDPKVISGKKPRFEGNLYDYVTEKLGWNEKHVMTSHGTDGESLRNTTIERINKRFQDGDYGMIGFNGNPERINRLKAAGLIDENAKGIEGHCFNWIKINGEVRFFDCAPEGGPYDATDYFNKADFTKDAEFVCYNKAKSAK